MRAVATFLLGLVVSLVTGCGGRLHPLNCDMHRAGYYYSENGSAPFKFIDERTVDDEHGVRIASTDVHRTELHVSGQQKKEAILYHLKHPRTDISGEAQYYLIVGQQPGSNDVAEVQPFVENGVNLISLRTPGWMYFCGVYPIGGTVRTTAAASGTDFMLELYRGSTIADVYDTAILIEKGDDGRGNFSGIHVKQKSSPPHEKPIPHDKEYHGVKVDGDGQLPDPTPINNDNGRLDQLIDRAKHLADLADIRFKERPFRVKGP